MAYKHDKGQSSFGKPDFVELYTEDQSATRWQFGSLFIAILSSNQAWYEVGITTTHVNPTAATMQTINRWKVTQVL